MQFKQTLCCQLTSTPSPSITAAIIHPSLALLWPCSHSCFTCCVSEKHDSTTRTVSTQSLFSVGTQRKPGTQGPERRGLEVTLTQGQDMGDTPWGKRWGESSLTRREEQKWEKDECKKGKRLEQSTLPWVC